MGGRHIFFEVELYGSILLQSVCSNNAKKSKLKDYKIN